MRSVEGGKRGGGPVWRRTSTQPWREQALVRASLDEWLSETKQCSWVCSSHWTACSRHTASGIPRHSVNDGNYSEWRCISALAPPLLPFLPPQPEPPLEPPLDSPPSPASLVCSFSGAPPGAIYAGPRRGARRADAGGGQNGALQGRTRGGRSQRRGASRVDVPERPAGSPGVCPPR